jgi:chromosome segregation ATPase
VCDTRSENQCLCKQLETTKHHLTNAIHENGRMSDELATITAELNATKKCLNDSQKDSEIIRSKLQSYIHEIERIDGLISMKDNDRKQTLCQYKDLECQFKSLDQESSESKRIITEYEQHIKIITSQLHAKEIDIETLEKQLIDIASEVEIIRGENMKLHAELEAQRNLCEKLDIQKEKQKAELIEYQLSCKELLEKNDKLREEILILREIGAGDTHLSASYHPTM